MCIAIVKPVNIELPSEEILYNCFKKNPHGAGFSYAEDGFVIINKGFENFDDFYKSFLNSKASKDKLVFIHFRIANKGLKDRGNTHPFPVCNNIYKLRMIKQNVCKYALIHNGLFYYNETDYLKYDPLNIISDTMLFTMILSDKMDSLNANIENIHKDYRLANVIAFNLIKNTEEYTPYVNDLIKNQCRFAIMDGNNNFQLYGKWEKENGIYYSNNSFRSSNAITKYTYIPCYSCATMKEKNEMIQTHLGHYCLNCYHEIYRVIYGNRAITCSKCKAIRMKSIIYVNNMPYCLNCIKDLQYNCCEICDKRIEANKHICDECKNKIINKNKGNETNVYCSN